MNFHNAVIEDCIKWKSNYSMIGLKIRNRLGFDVSNMVVVFAQSPLSPSIDWNLVDVSSNVNIDSLVEVSVGDIKSKEEKTVLREIEYTDKKRGYWQVYFNIKNYYGYIKTNKALACPWRQDNGKIVHITLGKRENEYLVEFVFESGSAHFLLDGLDGLQPRFKLDSNHFPATKPKIKSKSSEFLNELANLPENYLREKKLST